MIEKKQVIAKNFYTKLALYMCKVSGTSSPKKGVSCRRAAFDITSQHKTTLSLKTRN